MDGLTKRWMDCWIDRWVYWIDRWMGFIGWIDGWVYWMDGWMVMNYLHGRLLDGNIDEQRCVK